MQDSGMLYRCFRCLTLWYFFIRLAGVVNSINTDSAWKTKTFTEEKREFWSVIREEFIVPVRIVEKIKKAVNTD